MQERSEALFRTALVALKTLDSRCTRGKQVELEANIQVPARPSACISISSPMVYTPPPCALWLSGLPAACCTPPPLPRDSNKVIPRGLPFCMPAHLGFFAFCGDVTPGLYPPPCPKTGQVPKKCGSTRGWSLDKPAKPRFLHMKKMHYMGLKCIPRTYMRRRRRKNFGY